MVLPSFSLASLSSSSFLAASCPFTRSSISRLEISISFSFFSSLSDFAAASWAFALASSACVQADSAFFLASSSILSFISASNLAFASSTELSLASSPAISSLTLDSTSALIFSRSLSRSTLPIRLSFSLSRILLCRSSSASALSTFFFSVCSALTLISSSFKESAS